jgi:hypothetical protein
VDLDAESSFNIGAMSSTINKIKSVSKLTQPKFNEKYNVWVVRVKTDIGWKAIWRKEKAKSIKIFEKMSKIFEKTKRLNEEVNQSEKSNTLNDWNDKMNSEEETGRIPHNVDSFKNTEKKSSSIVGKIFGSKQTNK